MDNKDLKYIKKHYGEKMAHICRAYFPTLLEQPGLLVETMEYLFAHSKSLADDLENEGKLSDFKSYVITTSNIIAPKLHPESLKDPVELMDEAGYILYPECKTEADILAFKEYYQRDELLCTFNGRRLERCRVWFAVKKNVDEIKRENFPNPQRDDEYGTSVISIQFDIGSVNYLSIKNRYNEKVDNPDCTLFNNLENIAPGLTASFEHFYGLTTDPMKQSNLELKHYIRSREGKFYRKLEHLAPVAYCENNVVLDGSKHEYAYDPARYVVCDGYIIDTKKECPSIFTLERDAVTRKSDTFTRSFGNIKSISIEKNEADQKVVRFKITRGEDILLTLDENNNIVGIVNNNLTKIDDGFLLFSTNLRSLEFGRLVEVSPTFKNVLKRNKHLESINANILTSNNSGSTID